MKLKSDWVFNYKKGIREAMVSWNYHVQGEKLYFVLLYGSFPFTSVLVELDMSTQESRTLYEVDHIVRSFKVEKDRFYFTAMNGYAYCVDKDGKLIWEKLVKDDNASPELLIDGDRLYISNYSMFCLDKNTGDIIWTNDSYSEKCNCNILNYKDYIISGELEGKVFCLEKATGKKVWDYGKKEWVSKCVLMDNGHLMVELINNGLLIFDPESGKLIKKIKLKGKLYTTPVFDGDRLYIGDGSSVMNSESGSMTCYEVSGDDIKKVYSYEISGEISTPAVIDGDKLYFAGENNYLYCIDKTTGKELMTKKKTKGVCRDIYVEDKGLIVISDKGQVEHFQLS